jgi:hypothetical protein
VGSLPDELGVVRGGRNNQLAPDAPLGRLLLKGRSIMDMPAPRKLALALALVSGASVSTVEAQTPQATDWGSVTILGGGWVEDVMSVYHSAPIRNPTQCAVTNSGYSTNAADAGHSLFHTLLLSAFLNRVEVQLLISGCAYSKPRIVGVNLRHP